MEFRIADTFTRSLARLTGDEQKAVKTSAFDLQINPANPGLQFHRLDRARDRNFWSVRVNADIRLIVHRTAASLLLCYVDHHDKAYDWAERRKLEVHPTTGAAQIVEIRESVREIVIQSVCPAPNAKAAPEPAALKAALFAEQSDQELLGFGVPPEWLADVRRADEDSLLALADHLPAEAAEALLELATGGQPRVKAPAAPAADPFAHPDAQRRFRTMTSVVELERAFDAPWEQWTVFLHPAQREIVQRRYAGPARVSGSAGTGKTVVALHRAVELARREEHARVLLATFSEPLASALYAKLRRLVSGEPRLADRLEVHSLDTVALRLYRANGGRHRLAGSGDVKRALETAAAAAEAHRFTASFLRAEWDDVVDAWQIDSWEAYRDVPRLGRRTRLAEAQRKLLWAIFNDARARLAAAGVVTLAGMYAELTAATHKASHPAFTHAVIDEAQDVGVPQLRFLAALGGERPDALFFAGDLGQRIFQPPFSWRALGVDIRGRSSTLRVNYRTSHQIRMKADLLLPAEIRDADGTPEDRARTISAFNGPPPALELHKDADAEIASVAAWLKARVAEGVQPHEIGVFVRSDGQLLRARAALTSAGIPHKLLDDRVNTVSGYASVGTMHLAKGLEFRAVAVIACDDEVLPLQERIESAGEQADLEDIYDTERHLLYVACTRARDQLILSGVEPGSEFFEDVRSSAN